jgi:OOP family OmpA-OmpF porin
MARVQAALIALAFLAGMTALPASAQIGSISGPYAGGSVGVTKVKTFCTDPAWFGGVAGCDNNGIAWRAFGGYQFSRYTAVEIGYHNLGKAQTPAADVRFDAFDAVGLVALPLGSFSVHGKFGLMRGAAKGPGGKEDHVDITYGAGVQYEITRQIAVRGEWQRYPGFGGPPAFGADTDIDVFTLGALYRF